MRIIYFDIDCLRPDHLGCYGYHRPTSPNIDAIAAEGARFDHYYCCSSPCLPSRTAWSSGRFGIRNGVCSNHGMGAQFYMRTRHYGGPEPENECLTRQMRRHGYDTISISNFADRHNAMWFMRGWTEFHTPNLRGGYETAEEVNEPLLRWLRQNATREDYLLHINYWDVHRVYKMDASWGDRFEGMPVAQEWPDEAAIAAHQSIEGPFTATWQFPGGVSPYPLMPGSVSSREDFERMVTGYDASIAYVDHYLGLVMEELDRQGVMDDVAIIISADHGDAFGEHGIYSDHVCADECIHHIPLIVCALVHQNHGAVGHIVRVNGVFVHRVQLLDIPHDGRGGRCSIHRAAPHLIAGDDRGLAFGRFSSHISSRKRLLHNACYFGRRARHRVDETI